MISEVMTVEQLAEYLQIDKQTVYRKARSGQIPSVHIGRVLRFKKDVVDGWLRMMSMNWTEKKRKNLESWAEGFAKSRNIKEADVLKAVKKRRA